MQNPVACVFWSTKTKAHSFGMPCWMTDVGVNSVDAQVTRPAHASSSEGAEVIVVTLLFWSPQLAESSMLANQYPKAVRLLVSMLKTRD